MRGVINTAESKLILEATGPVMQTINQLKDENADMKCQIRILREKLDMALYENKLQMSEIVRMRRLLEHYEDGAPNYVATH